MKFKSSKNTAILIFANSSKEELRQKPFAKNPILFEAMTEQTLLEVQKTGIPYYHCTEIEQKGATFGERFVNAIESIYELGFENIITVGNDCPQLKATHLNKAYQHLQLGQTILGPSRDGGFYLMGLHHSNFDRDLFIRLPWQRLGLFNSITTVFNTLSNGLYLLPVHQDIDSLLDVKKVLAFSKDLSKNLIKILQGLIEDNKKTVVSRCLLIRHLFSSHYYNKGSPMILNTL